MLQKQNSVSQKEVKEELESKHKLHSDSEEPLAMEDDKDGRQTESEPRTPMRKEARTGSETCPLDNVGLLVSSLFIVLLFSPFFHITNNY